MELSCETIIYYCVVNSQFTATYTPDIANCSIDNPITTYRENCIATVSGSLPVDVASGSGVAVGMQGVSAILWVGLALIVLSLAINQGLVWFVRK